MEIEGPPLDEPAPPLDDVLREGLGAGPENIAIESAYRQVSWTDLEEESTGWRRVTGRSASSPVTGWRR